MHVVRVAHTAELDAPTLEAVHAMLVEAFAGDYAPDDWEHALGGMHALAWEGEAIVGHAALIQRRLLHGGRALRAGYVEGVGVRADRRGRGIGAALMEPLERLLRGAFDVGGLGATDAGARLYERRGWVRWRGPTSALTPSGIVRTADADGAVYVLPLGVPLDLDGELTCDWRDGDVW
jgi:aminoglycoside 2'-N-acetyltransferase I